MRSTVLLLLALAPLGPARASDYFTPSHRLSGIGASRDDLSQELINARTDLMIQSQTFTIMRDPLALPGARRITENKKLQSVFAAAAARSGIPSTLLEAIAYLESWGDPRAESPTGPRGIMQISQGTAREMGLRVVSVTRYRVTTERVRVKNKRGRFVYRKVRHRIPYTVPVRDDRLMPERAIPAVARYLSNLEQKFGGRDWAIFAYHCGEGCVTEMLDLTRRARGIPKDQVTVARMFFSCSPAWNRELYQAVEMQMQRDYSPTYWFRVMRAEQLLGLYRREPEAFEALAEDYRSQFSSPGGLPPRAPHRLSVWLKRDDIIFRSRDDIRSGTGTTLVSAFNRPDYFGYILHLEPDGPLALDSFSQASPAAVGTLTYIAFETRQLWEQLKPRGEHFHPLEVTSLVEPEGDVRSATHSEALAHGSGQVFDIDYASLPPGEYECLRFVLDDMGWDGYLGFVEEGKNTLHIGCSPSARDFFTTIFLEAEGKKNAEPAVQETPVTRNSTSSESQ